MQIFLINKQFFWAVTKQAGMGPADADIICSTMNLPLTFGCWSMEGNFGVVQELVGKVEVAATAISDTQPMCMNEETGLTKDVIFSGGTVLLV